ncbi:hypothetical protein CKY51_12560 [Xanthomonas maliensis]|nr:hypothetical protein CKY51_12560 [Xanthomonas maliensis]
MRRNRAWCPGNDTADAGRWQRGTVLDAATETSIFMAVAAMRRVDPQRRASLPDTWIGIARAATMPT